MKGIIGVDIGTTGTKTAIYDTSGTLLAQSYQDSRVHCNGDGQIEENPLDFYYAALDTIAEAMKKISGAKPEIAAIAVDGQMAGLLGVNREFQPTTPYDSWLDTRCADYVDAIQKEAELAIIESAGLPTMPAHLAKILWWQQLRPEIYEQTAKFVMPAGFVAARMCGLPASEAFIDETYCHFTGLYDFANRRWNDKLCKRFSVSPDKLPRVSNPWDIIGTLTTEAAKRCGLTTQVAVVAGCGDQAAGFFGAGIVEPGILVDVAGTASVFGCSVSDFRPDTKNRTILFSKGVEENLWFPHAFLPGGGLCLRWFRDELMAGNRMTYEKIGQALSGVANRPTGILFRPYLNGRSFPFDSGLRGGFAGLCLDTDYAQLYRSVMEGVAYEYQFYMELEQELFPEVCFDQVITYGGGAKSQQFNQLKADVLGVSYTTIDRDEVATFGSALIAGYGVGLFDNLKETVKTMTKQHLLAEPDPENYKRYREYDAIYKEYVQDSTTIEHRLTQLRKEDYRCVIK